MPHPLDPIEEECDELIRRMLTVDPNPGNGYEQDLWRHQIVVALTRIWNKALEEARKARPKVPRSEQTFNMVGHLNEWSDAISSLKRPV